MVPEIEIFRTYNFRTLIILVWMRIMGRKKTPSSQIPWRIRKNLQFWKIFDFEGVSPYTSWSISIPRFRRYLRTDSTQATQNFSIGIISDAESDGNKIFRKLKNFSISRNKVRVQPFRSPQNFENSIERRRTIILYLINYNLEDISWTLESSHTEWFLNDNLQK